jgi:hypothetical protein
MTPCSLVDKYKGFGGFRCLLTWDVEAVSSCCHSDVKFVDVHTLFIYVHGYVCRGVFLILNLVAVVTKFG